jgi:hypothetical protein
MFLWVVQQCILQTRDNLQWKTFLPNLILSRVGVLCVRWLIRRGFLLDDWIYCPLYIHTARDYRQYSSIAELHASQFTVKRALGLSVFTSRILATDISQSHCNFKSNMKSSSHTVIPFLPLFSTQFNSSAPKLISRQAGVPKLDFPLSTILSLYKPSAGVTQKTASLLLERLVYWSVA